MRISHQCSIHNIYQRFRNWKKKCHVTLLYSITLSLNELLVNFRKEWESENVQQTFSLYEFIQSKIKSILLYSLYLKIVTLALNMYLWLGIADCFALPPLYQSSSLFFYCRYWKTKNYIFDTSLSLRFWTLIESH